MSEDIPIRISAAALTEAAMRADGCLTDIDSLNERVRILEDLKLEIVGPDAKGGRFGAVEKQVSGFVRWLLGGAVAAITAAVTAIYSSGAHAADTEARLRQLEKQVEKMADKVDRLLERPNYRHTPAPQPVGDDP